jgi:uncharacterized membrane protein YcgQ (UPF0703/DUF1980 family)
MECLLCLSCLNIIYVSGVHGHLNTKMEMYIPMEYGTLFFRCILSNFIYLVVLGAHLLQIHMLLHTDVTLFRVRNQFSVKVLFRLHVL